jgi:D-lactate dehydrogenase
MAFPNVIVSPHMAFYTAEDVEAMIRNSASALLAFERGEETPFEVRH